MTHYAPWVVAALVLASGVFLIAPAPSAVASIPRPSLLGPAVSPAAFPAPTVGRITVAPSFVPPAGSHVLGAADPGASTTVAVGLSVRDPQGLGAVLAAEYTPGTPLYHGFLSPTSLASRFGPSADTVHAAEQYFAGFGLSVTSEPNGLLLLVHGPRAAVASAFGTTFDEYEDASGNLLISHPTPATLPAGIPWAGALGFGNVTPIVPASREGSTERPVAGPAAGCANGPGGLSPCQIQTAYGFSSLIANGTNGLGERIGIVDAYSGDEPQTQLAADFATFTGEFSLPGGGVQYLYPVPTPQNLNLTSVNPDWGLEEALDLEWARAAAPGASLSMTFSPDATVGLYTAIDSLVATASVNVLSLSWGEPDVGVFNSFSTPCSSGCNATTDGSYALLGPVLEFAAAEGISVFAASGDCGAADGTGGQSTNFPASDPYVTGVGGTVLSVGPNGNYTAETGWSGNATGSVAPGCVNQGGSGGGFAPTSRPWWQVGAGLPSVPSERGVPDVALDAGASVSTVVGGRSTGVVGTSVATPIWAGLAAVADQHAGAALGFLDPALYRIAQGANYSRDFHDILSGNNGYSAGPGWDPVTGLGSPVAASLVGDLAAVPISTAGAPSVYLHATPRFGAVPLTVSFEVTAAGGSGSYPLEGVYFGEGNASLANGVVSHQFSKPGVYSAVGWVVDSHGNTSASLPVAIVAGGGAALSVGLTVSNPVPPVGTSVTFTASATGGTPPYTYGFTFGDGTALANATSAAVSHAYEAAGGFCAEVVVADSAATPDGGASGRVAVSVGGAPAPDCGNASTPLSLTPVATGRVRDAPAEFPHLFQVSGGATPPPGLVDSVQYESNDSYLAACECALIRNPGSYTIEAWANDTVNGEATAVTNVTVAPGLQGAFAVSRSSGPAPLYDVFFASTRGGYEADANRTVWTFGNGDGAVGHTVNTTYDQPGEYLAVGHVEDAGHGNASEAFLIDVLPPVPVPVTGIVGSISPAIDVLSASTVEFTASIVGATGGIPLTVGWNLGLGNSAFGPGANQSYFGPFPSPLPNTLSGSISALLPNTVSVDEVPFSLPTFFAEEAGGFMPRASALGLSSHVSPTFGFTPLTVAAVATVLGPVPASTSWDFGDGVILSSNPVLHVYYGAGDYTVQAIAQDAFYDRVVDSYQLVANGPLQIFGGPSPSGGVPPVTVTFSALGIGGTGPPYTYHWTLENGTTATGTTVTATYRSLGEYWATVNVSDSSGTTVNRTFTVDIHPPTALTGPEILSIAGGIGAAIVVVDRGGWLRRRPGRPSLSQRRQAEAVQRVV